MHMQMVTRQAPVSRGRLAVPQAPRDCPNDIIDLINDCTTFAPVSILIRQVSPLLSGHFRLNHESSKYAFRIDSIRYQYLCCTGAFQVEAMEISH